MKTIKKVFVAALAGCFLSTASFAADANMVEEGKKIFMTKKLGNCIACHDVNGITMDGPGSFGPKLTGLKHWDEKTLYDTVYDIYSARGLKVSPMPAFGKTGWLSDSEIKKVVAFLQTIE
jgi:sulfur-oxidizing protein SoxX